jgi:hypothetical protein
MSEALVFNMEGDVSMVEFVIDCSFQGADRFCLQRLNQPRLIVGRQPDPYHGQGFIPAETPQSPVSTPVIHEPDSYGYFPFNDKYGICADGYGTSNRNPTTRGHRICGLRATTSWLFLALIIIIIAAAIGGGVWGSMAVRNGRT